LSHELVIHCYPKHTQINPLIPKNTEIDPNNLKKYPNNTPQEKFLPHVTVRNHENPLFFKEKFFLIFFEKKD